MSEIITLNSEKMTRFVALLDRIESGLEKMASDYKPTLNGERFITDKELRKRLRISDRTLQNWRNNGKIAYVQFEDGGKVMYAESEVERVLKSHLQEAWNSDQ